MGKRGGITSLFYFKFGIINNWNYLYTAKKIMENSFLTRMDLNRLHDIIKNAQQVYEARIMHLDDDSMGNELTRIYRDEQMRMMEFIKDIEQQTFKARREAEKSDNGEEVK